MMMLIALLYSSAVMGQMETSSFMNEMTNEVCTSAAAAGDASASTRKTSIPPRPDDAAGGQAFAEQVADLPAQAREQAIVQEILRGNIPEFLRGFVPVSAKGKPGGTSVCVVEVMPDYLAIGSDADFVRMPMTPRSATQIASAFGCMLPTRKLVNDIYAQAEVKLKPQPMTEARESMETFVAHNALIEGLRSRRPLGQLVAGIKKDVVLTNRLKEKPARVAIYGWHEPDAKPIQPLTIVHGEGYVDYSHGVRLVRDRVIVDGEEMSLDALLRDPKLCELVSDEGVIDARYP